MNAVDIKIGKRAKVRYLTPKHELDGIANIGDEVVIVGVPIVLCKLPNGKLERFYCHEIEEVAEKVKNNEQKNQG